MATPKKKHSKQRSRVRHTAWKQVQQKKLLNNINIVTCSSCGARIPERTACSECGMYKGIQILKKQTSDEVTVVKA
jgi:ribosomal protein L32